MMSVVKPQGRREDEFHDNFHFLCNLKRYVFVQVYSQDLIFVLKPCGSPREKLFRKFLQSVFASLVCSQCQLPITCCNQTTSQKNGTGMRALEICLYCLLKFRCPKSQRKASIFLHPCKLPPLQYWFQHQIQGDKCCTMLFQHILKQITFKWYKEA